MLQEMYEQVTSQVPSSVELCKISLAHVKPTDYNQLAFIKSCLIFCNDKNITVEFTDINERMQAIIPELTGSLNYREKPQAKSLFLLAGETVYKMGSDSIKLVNFFDTLLRNVAFCIRHPSKVNWRETFYYIDSTGADAVPIVVMICFLVGVIIGYQGTDALGMFGLDIYIADLVAMSIVRELGPLMVAVICAGRAGSAFAAELGTMKVNEELDALTTMGLHPQNLLLMPKMIALIFVMPLLTVIGNVVGIFGGGCLAVLTTDITSTEFYTRTINFITIANVGESLTKSVIFAALIAAISCFRGFNADNDAKGVGNAATSAVVSSIFLIILADAAVTFFYPQVMRLIGVNY